MGEGPETSGGTGRGTVETRTRVYLNGVGEDELPLVYKREATELGPTGLIESVDIRLREANACQHVVHTGAEVGGSCSNPSCRRLLCAECAREKENQCECGRLVCGSCRRTVWSRGEERILCPSCARRWWFREATLAALVAILAFLGIAFLVPHDF